MPLQRTVLRCFPKITKSKQTSGRAFPQAAHATAARDASAGANPRAARFLQFGLPSQEARPKMAGRQGSPFPENQNPYGRRRRRDSPLRDHCSSRVLRRRKSPAIAAAGPQIPASRWLGSRGGMRRISSRHRRNKPFFADCNPSPGQFRFRDLSSPKSSRTQPNRMLTPPGIRQPGHFLFPTFASNRREACFSCLSCFARFAGWRFGCNWASRRVMLLKW